MPAAAVYVRLLWCAVPEAELGQCQLRQHRGTPPAPGDGGILEDNVGSPVPACWVALAPPGLSLAPGEAGHRRTLSMDGQVGSQVPTCSPSPTSTGVLPHWMWPWELCFTQRMDLEGRAG